MVKLLEPGHPIRFAEEKDSAIPAFLVCFGYNYERGLDRSTGCVECQIDAGALRPAQRPSWSML